METVVLAAFTHMVFVRGVPGQIPQQAGKRPELHVIVGVQQIEQDGQHPLLLGHHATQHRRPLAESSKQGQSYSR